MKCAPVMPCGTETRNTGEKLHWLACRNGLVASIIAMGEACLHSALEKPRKSRVARKRSGRGEGATRRRRCAEFVEKCSIRDG
jgi:hypothetical protein